MKVELSDQVITFVMCQHPEPRRKLRLALRKLASERGDIKMLEGPLSGYQRLRVGPYRVLFAYCTSPGPGTRIQCIFAERRDTVYTVFRQMLEDDLLGRNS